MGWAFRTLPHPSSTDQRHFRATLPCMPRSASTRLMRAPNDASLCICYISDCNMSSKWIKRGQEVVRQEILICCDMCSRIARYGLKDVRCHDPLLLANNIFLVLYTHTQNYKAQNTLVCPHICSSSSQHPWGLTLHSSFPCLQNQRAWWIVKHNKRKTNLILYAMTNNNTKHFLCRILKQKKKQTHLSHIVT